MLFEMHTRRRFASHVRMRVNYTTKSAVLTMLDRLSEGGDRGQMHTAESLLWRARHVWRHCQVPLRTTVPGGSESSTTPASAEKMGSAQQKTTTKA